MNPLHRQQLREQELERKGWRIIDKIDHDTHQSAKVKGKYPEKSVWVYMTGNVWAPPQSKEA